MLKYRLLFGTLMTLFFTGVVVLDGWFDGSISPAQPDKPIQATGLCILIALLAIPAQLEMALLARRVNAKLFKAAAIPGAIFVSMNWYWPQFYGSEAIKFQLFYVLFVVAFVLIAGFIYQAKCCGTAGVIVNCSVNCFSVLYLGLLSSFVLGVRIDFGLWPLLMFVFVVKFSDIGAYTIGRLFGKHKFSPRISPGKTWEGLAGAIGAAIGIAILFAAGFDIMMWSAAAAFGLCMAVIGQLGDLAESMLKRDAEQKDSSAAVPGFGGILDVIDSPLVAAPFAYLFFMAFS